MDMVRALLPLAAAAVLLAQGLSLTIGNTVAATGGFGSKSKFLSQFIFRVNGCQDLSKAQVSANAEGVVNGERRSTPIRFGQPVSPGVYAVERQWANEGKWVVAITTICGGETAAAIVPVNQVGFARESTQVLSRALTPAEIETALKNFIPTPPPQR